MLKGKVMKLCSPSVALGLAMSASARIATAETQALDLVDPRWSNTVLQAAQNYEDLGRVDDLYRWAPWLCGDPRPPKVRMSQSSDSGTHGQKLYSLFVKNRDDYITGDGNVSSGQVLVKEAWATERAPAKWRPAKYAGRKIGEPTRLQRWAERDGKFYRATSKRTLFVMVKVGVTEPGTDVGWIYGTLDVPTNRVTSAGVVSSCVECHTKAPRDRLFGLAYATRDAKPGIRLPRAATGKGRWR